jgi:photoactive yellow protein
LALHLVSANDKIGIRLVRSLVWGQLVTTSAAATSFFFTKVNSISEAELDSLPYGVIQLDAEGAVLRYNAFEAGLSGLTRQKVVGKNFFKQVAPCTDVQQFYGRLQGGVAAGALHCTFRFHFAFKQNPRDVTVTLFYNERDKTIWVLVQPFEGKTTAELWGRR